MLGRIAALTLKEMLSLWKSPRMRLVVLLPPLIQVFVFTFAATFEVKNVPLGVWNEDATAASREFVRRFSDSPAFRLVGAVDNPAQVRDWINAQRATAILHIDQRFTADLATGRAADIQLLIDGRRSNVALIIQNYANSIVASFNQERLGEVGPSIDTRAWFNPNLDSQWYVLPGLNAVLVMIMAMLITALSVARERELGTFDQLLVTPLRPMEILIGKVIPALVIGMGEAFCILFLAIYFFGVPFRGSLEWFALGIFVFLLSAIGVGLMISSIASTQQQAILGVFMFLAPAVILSGFATPIANMPEWCQILSFANPIRYMVDLSRSLYLRDPEAPMIIELLVPMAIIGGLTLSSATILFRRRL